MPTKSEFPSREFFRAIELADAVKTAIERGDSRALLREAKRLLALAERVVAHNAAA